MYNTEYDWTSEARDVTAISEALDSQQRRREQEPVLYCKIVARWPVKTFLLTLGAHIIMIIISGVLLATGYDLLPLSFEDLPLYLNDRPWRARGLAWQDRNTFPRYYDRTPTAGYRTGSSPWTSLDLYYDATDTGGNIFTKAHLEKIQTIENEIGSVKDFTDYCQVLEGSKNCSKPSSILRYFDGTFSAVSPIFNDKEFTNISGVLYEALTNAKTRKKFRYFLGTNYNITPTHAHSWITRSLFPLGYPIKNAKDEEEYRDIVQEYSIKYIKPVLNKYEQDRDQFKFSYRSVTLWVDDVTRQALLDVRWAGASVGFIFLLILFHTRSLWITCFAIISIISSFNTTNILYVAVIGFKYLGFFHILALFIVLGIGADDIFVFYDVWRNTACEEYPSLAHRLSDCYRKSVFSMLFTSFTTVVAFCSSAIAPLLATRSFGIFAAMVIAVNYLSVIIYFPTVVVMYHKYFEKFQWPCFILCRKTCCRQHSSSIGNQSSNKSKHNGHSNATNIVDDITPYDTKTETDDKRNGISSHTHIHSNGSIPNGDVHAVHDIHKPDDVTMEGDMVTIRDSSNNTTVYHGDIHRTWKGSKEVCVIKHSYTDMHDSNPAKNDSNGTQHNGSHVTCHDNKTFTSDENPKLANGFMAADDKQNKTGSHLTSSTNMQEVDAIVNAYKTKAEVTNSVQKAKSKRVKKPLLVRFFARRYFGFVTNRYARWIILLVMAGVLAAFIYQASTIKPDNELFDLLPEDHVYTRSNLHKLQSFVPSFGDETLQIMIVWGMLQKDMSNCHFSDPKCVGESVWDESFNPNTVEAQVALKEFCDKFQTFSEAEARDFRLKKDPYTGRYQIKCFIQNLQTFLEAESRATGQNWTLPYNRTKVRAFMEARPHFYNVSVVDDNFTNNLEIPISYWLSNKYTFRYSNDFYQYDRLIGEQTGPYSSPLENTTQWGKYYGNNIRYLAIEVNTTIKYRILGHVEGIPILTRWEDYVNAELAKMPKGMRNGFQIDNRQRWRWMEVQQMLVQNAIYGVVIGVSLAFPILVIATGNIITGFLATLSMCCSTICVIGVIPLGGWELGVIEALNMCMVVGLTVDYVVHLAEGYALSLNKDRLSRVQDMLDEMAVPVCFGAITTLGASMFMFLAKLSFFFQFGIFMFSTIGFSLLFAMGMFVTLLGIVGPENDTGNVRAILRKIGFCRERT